MALVGMVVPSIANLPPEPLNIMPPAPTTPPFWISRVPPEMTVTAAVPPAMTCSRPPKAMVVPLVVPPNATISVPLESTRSLVSMMPDETVKVCPLLMCIGIR